jgi:hypothetical protein
LAAEVEHGDRSAVRREGLGSGFADAAAGAGDDRYLTGEGLRHRAFQLGLLQAPVLDVEQVALGQRLEAADRLGVGDHPDGGLGQIGGDGGILGRGADAEQTDAGHEDQPRHGVEFDLDAADAGVLAREHLVVVGHVAVDSAVHSGLALVELGCRRCRHHQRLVLGANDVVGGHHAALADVGKIGGADVVQDLGVGAEVEHEALGLATSCGRPHGACTANYGGNVRG